MTFADGQPLRAASSALDDHVNSPCFSPTARYAHDVGCKARRARYARFEGHSFCIRVPHNYGNPRQRLAPLAFGIPSIVSDLQRLRRCLMPQLSRSDTGYAGTVRSIQVQAADNVADVAIW